MKKQNKSSKILGIVGLCTGWLFPIVGIILGIIGLSIKKEQGHEDRDKVLNILSIIIGVIFWVIWATLIL